MNKEPSADKKEQKKKPNILLRLLALLITAALMAGALMLVVHRDRFNLDALKRWLTYRSLTTGQSGQAEPFTHAGGEKLSLAYLDSGVLFSSATGTHYYSFSGDTYGEEVLPMDNPVLSASSSSGVVYDAGGQSLFLFKDAEKAFELSLPEGGEFLSARTNARGWLAVTAQESGYKGAVTVYDTEGEKVIQVNLSSTFAVDAALSPDNKTVAVVTMDQENGVFSSQILFYPVNSTQPSAQLDLGSMTVLDLDYETDRLWILGEDQLVVASPDGEILAAHSFGRSYLKGCDLGGDGFALLLTGRYQAGNATDALTIGPDGTILASVDLSTPVLDYDCAGSYCSILTGSNLVIFNNLAELYATLNNTQGARYTALSSNGTALLADSQQAWLYIPEL